jgi:hypothetical protein
MKNSMSGKKFVKYNQKKNFLEELMAPAFTQMVHSAWRI